MCAQPYSAHNEHGRRPGRLFQGIRPDAFITISHSRSQWPVEHAGDLEIVSYRRTEIEHNHEWVSKAGMLPELVAYHLFQTVGSLNMRFSSRVNAHGELAWSACIRCPRVRTDPDVTAFAAIFERRWLIRRIGGQIAGSCVRTGIESRHVLCRSGLSR